MITQRLKLSIELVPSTIWYANIYNYYKNAHQMDKWHELKQFLFETEGRYCWICKKEERTLEAHEFWEYDDYKHIQKLGAIHHLCDLCHKIKHIGLWCHTSDGQSKLKKAGLTRDDLIRHFCLVNRCEWNDFFNYEDAAFKQYSRRSQFQWRQELGKYKPQFGLKELKSQQKLMN